VFFVAVPYTYGMEYRSRTGTKFFKIRSADRVQLPSLDLDTLVSIASNNASDDDEFCFESFLAVSTLCDYSLFNISGVLLYWGSRVAGLPFSRIIPRSESV
jgi:hypothetical protein